MQRRVLFNHIYNGTEKRFNSGLSNGGITKKKKKERVNSLQNPKKIYLFGLDKFEEKEKESKRAAQQ